MRKTFLTLFALGALALPAHALQPDEILPDPKLEKRAREISSELRCLVCQNQSIDDSDASLAKDLRTLVREQLKAGKTDQEIKSFLVDRYGNFVLLKPPFEWDTAALWLSPFALFAMGGFFLWRKGRNRKAEAPPPAPLSAEETEKLKALLADDAEKESRAGSHDLKVGAEISAPTLGSLLNSAPVEAGEVPSRDRTPLRDTQL